MKIATWNVNSIKARLPVFLQWLADEKPDVVLLQEIKTVNESFPAEDIESMGYNIVLNGQKSYNGVAIMSKWPIEDVVLQIPGNVEDTHARYIEAVTNNVRVISVYVPNGREVDSPHYHYKLEFLQHLRIHLQNLLKLEEKLIVGGDFNIAPTPDDVAGGDAKNSELHCSVPERLALNAIVNTGCIDAVRALHPSQTTGRNLYSWWDYRAGSWQKNKGMRIDFLYISPAAADVLVAAGISAEQRAKEKTSDHAPVWCVIS